MTARTGCLWRPCRGGGRLHGWLCRASAPAMMGCMKTIPVALMVGLVVLVQSGCVSRQPAAQTGGEGKVVATDLVQSTTSWDGALLPPYPPGQPQITIRRVVIPVGGQLPPHLHPVINAGILVRGQLTVKAANGKTIELKAGDPLVELVNTVHYGINSGNVPAEIVVVYAGSTNMPVSLPAK